MNAVQKVFCCMKLLTGDPAVCSGIGVDDALLFKKRSEIKNIRAIDCSENVDSNVFDRYFVKRRIAVDEAAVKGQEAEKHSQVKKVFTYGLW